MKDLLIEIEKKLIEKIDFHLSNLKGEENSLKFKKKPILFWEKNKQEREIARVRKTNRSLEAFFEEEMLFLSHISNYYFLNQPSETTQDNFHLILEEKEYKTRLMKKAVLLNYLEMLHQLVNLENASFLDYVIDEKRSQNKEIDLGEKHSLLRPSYTNYQNENEEEEMDPSVKAYLSFLLPKKMNVPNSEYQNIWEINYMALKEEWNYEEYIKKIQNYLISKEIKEIMSWQQAQECNFEITKEVALKAKQQILIFFSKLKDYQFELENEDLLQLENYLANSLVNVTNTIMSHQISK